MKISLDELRILTSREQPGWGGDLKRTLFLKIERKLNPQSGVSIENPYVLPSEEDSCYQKFKEKVTPETLEDVLVFEPRPTGLTRRDTPSYSSP